MWKILGRSLRREGGREEGKEGRRKGGEGREGGKKGQRKGWSLSAHVYQDHEKYRQPAVGLNMVIVQRGQAQGQHASKPPGQMSGV